MPLIAPQTQSKRFLVPAGTHVARVIGLIQIGTIPTTYMGEAKIVSKIRLTFELPEELHAFKEGEDARPLVHSQEYTLSMGSKSNLRPIVEGIIGTTLSDDEAFAFNHEQLLNLTCLVSVKHGKTAKGNEYAKIASTSKLMKGQVCKTAYNPLKVLTYEKWDEEYFNKLPDFIKDSMKTSKEYKAMKGIEDEAIDTNDVPF